MVNRLLSVVLSGPLRISHLSNFKVYEAHTESFWWTVLFLDEPEGSTTGESISGQAQSV